MPEWYCHVDKVKMVEAELTLSYMMLVQRVPGLRCPVCGVEYLTEKVATTTVRDAEAILEGK